MTASDVRAALARLLARLADPASEPRPDAPPRLGTHAGALPPQIEALLPSDPVPAAVLVALVDRADPAILLTQRAAHLRQHAGQISFPGGRIESRDADAAAAALREAEEEIGLAPHAVTLAGRLPDQVVLTGFRITPIVGQIAGQFTPRLDRNEVDDLFELPLSHLLDERNQQPYVRDVRGTAVTMRDIRFGTRRIWGATAGILLTLREYALG